MTDNEYVTHSLCCSLSEMEINSVCEEQSVVPLKGLSLTPGSEILEVPMTRHITTIRLATSPRIDTIRHRNIARLLQISLGGLSGRPQCDS